MKQKPVTTKQPRN